MEICEEVLGLLANLDAIAFQVTHLEVVGPLAILLNLADSYGAGREKVSSFLGVGTVEPGAEFIGRASRRPETDCVVILFEAQRNAVVAVVHVNFHLAKAKLLDIPGGRRGDVGDANEIGRSGGVEQCLDLPKNVRSRLAGRIISEFESCN